MTLKKVGIKIYFYEILYTITELTFMGYATNQLTAKSGYELLLAVIAWFAIILQLILTNGGIINFLSYFTILSNLLIALSLSITLIVSSSTAARFISRPTVNTALTLYIVIVGLVYNLILRGIWTPVGWQLLADNLLHVVTPLLYLIYWLFFSAKGTLTYLNGIQWIYFPLFYLIYSLIRGSFTGWYPYPFLNVHELGFEKVSLNIGMMVAAFMLVGLLLIAVNRWKRA